MSYVLCAMEYLLCLMHELSVDIFNIDREAQSPPGIFGYFCIDIFRRAWEFIAEFAAPPDDLIEILYQLSLAEYDHAFDIFSPVAFLLLILSEHTV